VRQLLRRTFVFNIYPFITNVYDRVDVVLLSRLAGSFATGIYALPYRAFATLSIIPYSLMGALLPVFSASPIQAGQVNVGTNSACARAMKFLYLVALLIVLLTLTLARPVILFTLGESYTDSIITLMILVWAAVPSFLNFALNTLLLSAHREKVFLLTATVCTVFNVAANLLLIPRYSFRAAAVVTVATECLLLAQNFYLVRKFSGRAVFPVDGFMITAVFALTLAGFWGLQSVMPLTLAGGLACFVFALFALAMVTGLRIRRTGLQVGSRS
jgi:O-antigen/teichoic acid export membrane protein